MTTVRVCVCDFNAENKILRFPIQVGNINGKTDILFSEVARQTDSSDGEFEIFYCGQKLNKGATLEAFNITSQSTLFVFRKVPQASSCKGLFSTQPDTEKTPLIHIAIQNPNYRKTVDHILTNPDALQKLLTAVPGLDKDPVTLSMLQDPELLQILISRHNLHNVSKKHPLFHAAAVYVAELVNEEQDRDPNRAVRGNVYSLDQMSDEEDEGNQRGAAGGSSQQPITTSQLAAALAAATASAVRPSTSASSTLHAQRPGSSGSATSVISPDFFQQAMMTAQSSALEAQLQQLRDMGIADENVARQALAATNGDMQAALELIFGDNVGH